MQSAITLWRFHDIIRPIEGHGSCTVCRDKQLAGQPVQYTWKGKKRYFQFFNLFPIQTLKIQFVSIYFRSQCPFSFPFHTHSVVHNLDYFLYFVNEYFRIEKYFDFGTDHFLFHATLVDVQRVCRRLHCIL